MPCPCCGTACQNTARPHEPYAVTASSIACIPQHRTCNGCSLPHWLTAIRDQRLTHNLHSPALPHWLLLDAGGLFELVSCPHYLAELIIYLGLLGIVGPYSWLPWLIMAWLVRRACSSSWHGRSA